jgi:hypothetical protein
MAEPQALASAASAASASISPALARSSRINWCGPASGSSFPLAGASGSYTG